MNKLQKLSAEIRLETLKTLKNRAFGHLGGSLSIVELLSVLYGEVMTYNPNNPNDDTRDYFVLSKGHAGPALYSTLAIKGFFDKEVLMTLNNNKTHLPSHPDRKLTPGIDMTTGSLGQGFSAAVGIAKGLKMANKDNRVFLVVGDGEMNEGQCYEAMLFAHHHKLDNLVVFIDENKQQLDGFTEDISDLLSLDDKFKSFGFDTRRVDGHNEMDILKEISEGLKVKDKPTVVILDTIKGKGIAEFEGITSNHHMRFDEEGMKILDRKINELKDLIK